MGKKEESVDLNALNAEEWDRLKASDGLIVVDVSLVRRESPGMTDPFLDILQVGRTLQCHEGHHFQNQGEGRER